MKLLPFFIISLALHGCIFLFYRASNNGRDVFIPKDGIVTVEIVSNQAAPQSSSTSNPISHAGDTAFSYKKNKASPKSIRKIGKEGNIQKIQAGNIKIIYPKESIRYKEEGVILVQVERKRGEKAKIKILKPSIHSRLNKAAIYAIEKAIFTMKEKASIEQIIQIQFKLQKY